MKYELIEIHLGAGRGVQLDFDDYDNIVKARSDLTNLISIEEKFDLTLENHFELEKEIAILAARDMMFYDYNPLDFWEAGNLLNRRIVNILSSGRAYIDHTDYNLSSIFGKNSQQQAIYRKTKSEIYDSNASYRIVDALRNYVQHRGFPLHRWSLGSKKVGDLNNPYYEYTLGASLSGVNFELDNKFKTRAIIDINELGGSVDIIWLLRDYIRNLSQLNHKVRQITETRSSAVKSILNDAISNYKLLHKIEYDASGLAAAQLDEDLHVVKADYIVPDAIKYYEKFIRKNVLLQNFERRYVATKTKTDTWHQA